MLWAACIVLICVLTVNGRAVIEPECDPGLVAVQVNSEGYRCELVDVVVRRTDNAANAEYAEYVDNLLDVSDELILSQLSVDESEDLVVDGTNYKQRKTTLRTEIEDAENKIEMLEERLDDLRDNFTQLIFHSPAPSASPTTDIFPTTTSSEFSSEWISSSEPPSAGNMADTTSEPPSAGNMADTTMTPYSNEATMNGTTTEEMAQEIRIKAALEDGAIVSPVSPLLNAEDCEKITIADPLYNENNGHFESEFKCYGTGYVFTDIKLIEGGGFMGRCCKTP